MRPEADGAADRLSLDDAAFARQRETGKDPMDLSRQHPQHSPGVIAISRLAENFAGEFDYRICPKHERAGPARGHRQRLFTSHPDGEVGSRLGFVASLVDAAFDDFEINACLRKQLTAPRRSGRQNQNRPLHRRWLEYLFAWHRPPKTGST